VGYRRSYSAVYLSQLVCADLPAGFFRREVCAVITLNGVSKQFGINSTHALHLTDLTMEGGKTTALIGPSGCGKSTLLRLIIGLLEPTAGSIKVEHQPVSPANMAGIRRKIGYVIQDGGLFPHFTARQNVMLMPGHLHTADADTSRRLNELCELTRFPLDGLDRYPVELSGGQRQRVSLMRALILDPSVLLLDEPLGALDPLVRSSLQTDLKQIFQRLKKTVVLVTHDMAEAAFLADRIVLLQAGRVVQQGTLDDLRDRPASSYVTEFMSAQRSLVQI
jgi:osmoprotectant transport system ATP-binding protein